MNICIGKFTIAGIALFFLIILLLSGAAYAVENNECLACHGEDINHDVFNSSIHGSNLCTSCHVEIKALPHPEGLKKPTCNQCHRIEAEIYNSSDHGVALKAGVNEAASCRNCHGNPHTLLDSRNSQSPVNRSNIPKTCASCHEDKEKMSKYALTEKMPYKSYSETVHGKALIEKGIISSAVCTDCHGSHDLHSLSNPKSKIYRANVPSTCSRCHENIFMTYERSVHGKAALAGKREAPVCTDCHGEHTIMSRKELGSSVYPTAISEKTCPQCHNAGKIISKYGLPGNRLKTYMESYHGLASKSGSTTVANCASCHGAHDILPSSDPNSSVNKKNLSKTCGKCHPGAGAQLAKGSVHITPSNKQDRIVFYVTVFYIVLIVLVIGGMCAYVFLDYLNKLREHYRIMKAEAKILRWTLNERIQHLLLVITFVVLAYTGFALRFSHAWWALPFTVIEKGFDWRGTLHRAMAAVFCLLCVYHAGFMFFVKRGRTELKALLPSLKDFLDLFNMLKHNLGFSKKKPAFARFNYIEKSEYWALIWGSIIMIVTGSMLVFENFIMQYFPKWLLDAAGVIHFYEAVLATLAILVWHLYFTVFQPGHYPMNWSWITGKVGDDERRKDDRLEKKEG